MPNFAAILGAKDLIVNAQLSIAEENTTLFFSGEKKISCSARSRASSLSFSNLLFYASLNCYVDSFTRFSFLNKSAMISSAIQLLAFSMI
jgi:hypothetical protein